MNVVEIVFQILTPRPRLFEIALTRFRDRFLDLPVAKTTPAVHCGHLFTLLGGAKQAEELAAATARAGKLEGLVLEISANAGEEGKLFGSIGTVDIADASTAAGNEIERSEVRLPDGPLRVIGEHQVEIHLHTDLNVMITVNIVADAAEAE